jgi:hypothetical protein
MARFPIVDQGLLEHLLLPSQIAMPKVHLVSTYDALRQAASSRSEAQPYIQPVDALGAAHGS